MQRQIKILAIDSEDIILKSIRKVFNYDDKAEYIITTCNTAMDGLKLVRNDIYNLILLDLAMPGINGIELLRRIKKINPDIPIVILSGYSSKNSYSDVISNGAENLLLKPFTIAELKSVVSNISKNDVSTG
jgi:two-component system response regulator PilR (NtrC family)